MKPSAVNTRSRENEACGCTICIIGKMCGAEYVNYEKKQRENAGRPRLKEEEICVAVTSCSYCHSQVGQGLPHDCTRTDMQDNLFDMIRCHSSKTQEQVTSKLLDTLFLEKGVSKQGGVAHLATKGTPKPVTVGKSRSKKSLPKFSIEDLTKLQVTRNLSDKDTLAVASFIRVKAGRVKPKKKKGDNDEDEEQTEKEDDLDELGMRKGPRALHHIDHLQIT